MADIPGSILICPSTSITDLKRTTFADPEVVLFLQSPSPTS